MKTRTFLPFLLLIGLLVVSPTISFSQDIKKVTAKYVEMNEDYQFVFQDKDKKTYVFDDVNYELEIDLYDESLIGTTFNLSWTEEEMEQYNEEGEPNGTYKTYRTIETLETVN